MRYLALVLLSLSVYGKEVSELQKQLNQLQEKVILISKNNNTNYNFEMSPSFRLRFQHRTNTPSPNRNKLSNFYDLQFRTQMKYKIDEKIKLIFTPQLSKNFGDGSPNDAGLDEGENSSMNLADIGVLEANITYRFKDGHSFKLGRQTMKFGDGLIVNNPKYNNYGRAFDSIRYDYKRSEQTLTLFTSKISDGDSDKNLKTVSSSNDIDFSGVYYSRSHQLIKALDFYTYLYNDQGSNSNLYGKGSNSKEKSNIYGARLILEQVGLNLRSEIVYQNHNNALSSGSYLGLLEPSLKIKKSVYSLELLYAGKNYRPFFTSRHKYLGAMDIIGMRNIFSKRLRYQRKVNSKSSIRIDLLHFRRAHVSEQAFNNIITKRFGNTDSSRNLGHEIDLTFKRNLEKGLTLKMGYSYFNAGDYLENINKKDYSHYGWFAISFKLK